MFCQFSGCVLRVLLPGTKRERPVPGWAAAPCDAGSGSATQDGTQDDRGADSQCDVPVPAALAPALVAVPTVGRQALAVVAPAAVERLRDSRVGIADGLAAVS